MNSRVRLGSVETAGLFGKTPIPTLNQHSHLGNCWDEKNELVTSKHQTWGVVTTSFVWHGKHRTSLVTKKLSTSFNECLTTWCDMGKGFGRAETLQKLWSGSLLPIPRELGSIRGSRSGRSAEKTAQQTASLFLEHLHVIFMSYSDRKATGFTQRCLRLLAVHNYVLKYLSPPFQLCGSKFAPLMKHSTHTHIGAPSKTSIQMSGLRAKSSFKLMVKLWKTHFDFFWSRFFRA